MLWLSDQTWTAIILTIKLASITTVFLLLIGIPIALWLARSKSYLSEIVATIIAIPLVLPPTVLGFYLLVLMAPNGFLSFIAPIFSLEKFAFTFQGLVIGSIVYSLPFVVQPIRNSFETMGVRPLEVAATLRISPFHAFWRVTLPITSPGIVTAAILGFAHTVGEYGVVQMIGGNLPGQTAVISTTIMSYVEADKMLEANILSVMMIVFSFIIILAVRLLQKFYNGVSYD
ncbi:molybdate ABC transporter permease subunit [Bartonella tamiae]|uniref:Molybdenum transport system permease n=1 Tax=Bartonella tamiae Th239 TaxID=1094558 RepID=J0ZS67_9HYPH|nr:molybdate ABC transporter permease subunit [Bartonella tamiae]EJF91578.1 molybdate ABC transporter, permease [Bartonella tamiae Th239]EJF92438.1 molybdate ABC transporter, permease [Bartonella tamiae Th307]